MNPGTANWIRGAGGAAVLAGLAVVVALSTGRSGSPGGAGATPGGSQAEEGSPGVQTASLQPAPLQGGSLESKAAAREELSPRAKAERVRILLQEARKALWGKEFDRTEQGLTEALRLDPGSVAAHALQADLKEEREQARVEALRRRISEQHERGLQALSRSDVDGALRAFRAAQGLDPSDSRTFRLIQHAHRVRSQQDARQRLQDFREGVGAGAGEADGAGTTEEPRREASAPASARPGEYVVQPEDVLQITVFEEPDLTTKARVSRAGEITLPLLGQAQLSGLTVIEAQEKLARLLGEDYLVHPQVQVFVDKPRNVFVTGEVHRPGSYPVSVERETTIMEILSMAGGFTEDADLNGTRIIRVEDGQKRTLRVRVGDIVRKGDKGQDVGVLADDIVFVPESFF